MVARPSRQRGGTARARSKLRCAALSGFIALVAARAGHAAATASFAAPAHQALPGPAGSALRVTFALIIVVAAVFAAGWLTRRMHGGSGTRSGALQVLAQLPLGPRERAVLVRVGSEQLLLGVANGSVRTLHVLPLAAVGESSPGAAALAPANQPAPQTFRSLLLKSLGR